MGILISNDGSITLPCLLFLIGIPLTTIGHFQYNNINDHSSSSSSGMTFEFNFFGMDFNFPIQFSIGIILIFMGFGCILRFQQLSRDETTHHARKKNGNDEKNDDDEIIMASFYSVDEILDELNQIANVQIQSKMTMMHDEQNQKQEEGTGGGGMVVSHEDLKKEECTKKFANKAICCLNSLALKCSRKEQQQQQQKQQKQQKQQEPQNKRSSGDKGDLDLKQNNNEKEKTTSKKSATSDKNSNDKILPSTKSLYLSCQEAAYIILRAFPHHDPTIASSLSLLALVSKDESVRERNLHQADQYGLDTPILAMRHSLVRSRKLLNPDEEEEQNSAELQRKGCLFLGALVDTTNTVTTITVGEEDDVAATDGPKSEIMDYSIEVATKVVDEDGLEAILDALEWFRFHIDVANWALWAIFTICYEHLANKRTLLKFGGIRKVCLVMEGLIHDVEEARNNKTQDSISNGNSECRGIIITSVTSRRVL